VSFAEGGPEIFKIEQRDLFQDLGIDPLGLLPQHLPFLRRKNNSLFAGQL